MSVRGGSAPATNKSVDAPQKLATVGALPPLQNLRTVSSTGARFGDAYGFGYTIEIGYAKPLLAAQPKKLVQFKHGDTKLDDLDIIVIATVSDVESNNLRGQLASELAALMNRTEAFQLFERPIMSNDLIPCKGQFDTFHAWYITNDEKKEQLKSIMRGKGLLGVVNEALGTGGDLELNKQAYKFSQTTSEDGTKVMLSVKRA